MVPKGIMGVCIGLILDKETFTAPLMPTAFSSYSNGSSTSINSDLSISCEEAASSANRYTIYTDTVDVVGVKPMIYTNTDIISYGSFTPPEECCVGADWGANCEITASRVGIIYWPPKTDRTSQGTADADQAVRTVVFDGFTL